MTESLFQIFIKMKGGAPENTTVGHVWQKCGDPIESSFDRIEEFIRYQEKRLHLFDIKFECVGSLITNGDFYSGLEAWSGSVDWDAELNKLIEETGDE